MTHRYLFLAIFGTLLCISFSAIDCPSFLSNQACENGCGMTIWFNVSNQIYNVQIYTNQTSADICLSEGLNLKNCFKDETHLCKYNFTSLLTGELMIFSTNNSTFNVVIYEHYDGLCVDTLDHYITNINQAEFNCTALSPTNQNTSTPSLPRKFFFEKN